MFRYFVIIVFLSVSVVGCKPSKEVQGKKKEVKKENNVVLVLRDPRYVDFALSTAESLKTGHNGFKANKVAIVFCGATISKIKKKDELTPVLIDLQDREVDVAVCELSFPMTKLKPDDIASGTRVVPNCMVESLRLQSLGYKEVQI